MKTYAGVGSRETPVEIGRKMSVFAKRLAAIDYTMVSGGARKPKHAIGDCVSADHVFEYAVAEVGGKMIIYRAYANKFVPCGKAIIRVPDDRLFEVAINYIRTNKIIPWWDKLTSWAKLLHARNYYQIVQENGHKVDFVIAYSALDDKGEPTGGTRTAIKIAERMGIKVYNLALPMDIAMLEGFIDELENKYKKRFDFGVTNDKVPPMF